MIRFIEHAHGCGPHTHDSLSRCVPWLQPTKEENGEEKAPDSTGMVLSHASFLFASWAP